MQYHQQTGIESFGCGEELEGHWRKSGKVTDSGQNPVVHPLWGWFDWKRNYSRWPVWVGQTGKSESQRVILVGRSSWKILYLSPFCQTLSKAFSMSRKAGTTCSPLLKLSIMDWDSLKRWSSVDLALLKPDWCLFINPVCSKWDLSRCSMTLSNSFIIELIRLMGL